jgi:hypothetical protein
LIGMFHAGKVLDMVVRQNLGGVWRKSSRSGVQSNCVQARFDGVVVWLHNSKDPSPGGPVIGLAVEQWLMLLDHVHAADLSPAHLDQPVRLGELLIASDGRHITVELHGTSPKVRYTPGEWQAFLEGVRHEGEFTPEWLLGDPATA